MAIARSIAKNMIQMKRWDYSYYSPPNWVLSPQTESIRRPFFHHKYYKKGENKIAITILMEQKFGSAEVGLQLHSSQIFQAFFLQLHNMRIFSAFLLKYGNRFYQTIKVGRGKRASREFYLTLQLKPE